MKINEISTQKYLLKYVYSAMSLGICLFFYDAISNKNNIIWGLTDNIILIVPAHILCTIFLILFLTFFVSRAYQRGFWTLNKDSLISDKRIECKINQIEFLRVFLNPIDPKPYGKRTLTSGGGNNWIEFEYNRKKMKFEFLLDGRESENEFLALVDEWKNSTIITVDKAPKAFFDYFEW